MFFYMGRCIVNICIVVIVIVVDVFFLVVVFVFLGVVFLMRWYFDKFLIEKEFRKVYGSFKWIYFFVLFINFCY